MPIGELLTLLVQEGKRRLVVMSAIFGVVALGVLGFGLNMAKRWEASTLITTDARSIIKPLLEGRAVPTTISDQNPVVTQVMGSRRILREIVAFGGWIKKPLGPTQEDRLLKGIKDRIKIEVSKEDNIRISYHDTDPERAYRVTNKLAEIFIRESTALKETQSREAFEFISRRVKEYEDKLTEAHEALLAHYRGEGVRAATLTTPTPVANSKTEPSTEGGGEPRRPRVSLEEIAALRAEEATLKAQLGQKPGAVSGAGEGRQEEQYRGRVLQLQTDLDRLRARYTEQHPDVLHAQRELKTAQDDLARAEKMRADRALVANAAAMLDSEVTRAATARLDLVQQKIAVATGIPRRRPGSSHAAAGATQADLEVRAVGQDTVLAELLRRYEATRDVYQDLLKRRENARVSMDLDSEHRGLVLRVQEAAELPVTSSSIRLLNVAMGGLVFATALPLALLFAFVSLDPRIRSAQQIERLVRLPLLVAIPSSASSREMSERRTQWLLAASIVAGVFVIYVAAFAMRAQT